MLHPIHTIGHGRQPIETFLELLKQHNIEFLCDVRSAARSRWPQFNGAALERVLLAHGIGYEHLPECGGKLPVPADERSRGLDRIIELAGELRVVLMCSESQPLTSHVTQRANCHRVGLLAPPLRQRGAEIIHILPDGSTLVLDEADVPSQW
jgi:ATP-dependent DNA helicase RecQ